MSGGGSNVHKNKGLCCTELNIYVEAVCGLKSPAPRAQRLGGHKATNALHEPLEIPGGGSKSLFAHLGRNDGCKGRWINPATPEML